MSETDTAMYVRWDAIDKLAIEKDEKEKAEREERSKNGTQTHADIMRGLYWKP